MDCRCNELHEYMIDLHHETVFRDYEVEVANMLAPFTSSQYIFPYVNSLKEEGNTYFKLGNVSHAFNIYTRAISFLVLSIPCCDHNFHPFYELATRLNLNIAACAIKLSKFDWAKLLCSCVLRFEPMNVKTLFRRGSASLGLGQFQAAKLDLELARKLEPNDKEIFKEWEKMNQLLENARETSQVSSINVNKKAVAKLTKVNQLKAPLLNFDPLKLPLTNIPNPCDIDGSESVGSNMNEEGVTSLDGRTTNSSGTSKTPSRQSLEKVSEMNFGQRCPTVNINVAEPKFRFSNRSRPGSILNLSPPYYRELANGRTKCYFHPRSTSFMTVRAVVKDITTFPAVQVYSPISRPSKDAMDVDCTSAVVNPSKLGCDTLKPSSNSCVAESCTSSMFQPQSSYKVNRCNSINQDTPAPCMEPQNHILIGLSNGTSKSRFVRTRARARFRGRDVYRKKRYWRHFWSARPKNTIGMKRKGWSNQYITCYPPWKKGRFSIVRQFKDQMSSY